MSEELYNNIHKRGKYYNPANSHYNNDNGVECNRCKKTQLQTCIGWKEYDLCLDCVSSIDNIQNGGFENKPSNTSIKTSVKKTSIKKFKTRMLQRLFRRNMPRKMKQKIFRI